MRQTLLPLLACPMGRGKLRVVVRRFSPVLALCVVVSWATAWAEPKSEIAPFVGFRFGGEVETLSDGTDVDIDAAAGFGLIFDKRLMKNRDASFEFVWSRQDTEVDVEGQPGSFPLDIDYFHVGATYSPGESDGFVVMTVGATHFDPGGGFGSETKFSMAAGGGVRKMFNRRLGVRVEGRAYLTFAGGSSKIFCSGGGSGANCLFSFDGDVILQAEVNAGLVVAF